MPPIKDRRQRFAYSLEDLKGVSFSAPVGKSGPADEARDDKGRWTAEAQEAAYQAGHDAYHSGAPRSNAPKDWRGKHWLGGWEDAHNEMTGVPPEDD